VTDMLLLGYGLLLFVIFFLLKVIIGNLWAHFKTPTVLKCSAYSQPKGVPTFCGNKATHSDYQGAPVCDEHTNPRD